MKRFGLIGMLLLSGGCGEDLKFNLIVYDSCSQFPLQSGQLSYLEVLVESESLAQPVREVFDFAAKRGTFEGLEPVTDAVVTVIARANDGNGQPGPARAASSVGLVDLSGDDGFEVVQISMVIGEIDTFISTTNTDVANQCTQQVVPRRGHTATLLPDGRVLLAGGSQVEANAVRLWTTTEIYNPRTGFFVAGPELRNGREGHTATALADGRVFIAGGESGDTVGTLRAAQLFDPDTNTLGVSISMQEQRAYHTATALADGRVLLAGGVERDPVSGALIYTATTEVYDPFSNATVPGPNLQRPRAFHAAVPIGPASVALIGGLDDGELVPNVEFVNPTGALAGPALNVPRSHLAAEIVPGRDAVLVVGGFDDVLDDPTRPASGTGSSSFEVLQLNLADLGSSVASCPGGVLQARRGDPALAPVPGGFIIAGGIASPGMANETAERMLFDGTTDLCAPTPSSPSASVLVSSPMLRPRAGFRLTPLIGGDLLATGGYTFDLTLPVGSRTAESTGTSELYIIGR